MQPAVLFVVGMGVSDGWGWGFTVPDTQTERLPTLIDASIVHRPFAARTIDNRAPFRGFQFKDIEHSLSSHVSDFQTSDS